MHNKSLFRLGIALFVFLFTFIRCEKDDICVSSTPSTPTLVIQFFDKDSPTITKNITSLYIKAQGQDTGIIYTDANSINFPLQTNTNETTYLIYNNFDIEKNTFDNVDSITFKYTTDDIYISRACGYKVTFTLEATNGIHIELDDNNWVSNPEIINYSITHNDSTHVKIYH